MKLVFALTDGDWCYRTLGKVGSDRWLMSYWLAVKDGRYKPVLSYALDKSKGTKQ